LKRRPSYRVEEFSSWDALGKRLAGPKYKGWAFRGQADAGWFLMSTLDRYLDAYIDKKYWQAQEERIKRIFRRKAHLFLSHIPEPSDTFQWLALMQHHGAPTRLLDFTWSPYVAAFFALERSTTEAAIWAINPKRLVNITERLNEFVEGRLRGTIGLGEPFVMNGRLIAQSGTFIVMKELGTPIEDVVRRSNSPDDTLVQFRLATPSIRPAGMRALFSMNITNATLFPDLDGLARSLAYELEFHWAHDPRKVPKGHHRGLRNLRGRRAS
jgi:FRG domain